MHQGPGQNARMPVAAVQFACRLVLLLLLVVITTLALMPPGPDGGEPAFGWDKADHLLAFAALAVCCRLAWWPLPVAGVTVALLAYGTLIELLQTMVPGRQGSVADLCADALGLAIGLLLVPLARKAMPKRWWLMS